MKKNNSIRIAIIVMALTLITSCFVGTTFAKYTASATVNSTGTVAAWSFEINNQNIATSTSTPTVLNVDLFAHADGNVKAGKIAPGTTGSVSLTVVNTSEVRAKYKVTFAETTDLAPVEFSLDGSTGWTNNLSTLSIAFTELASGATGSNIQLYWRWAFEPVAPTDPGVDATTEEQETYQTALAQYQIDLAAWNAADTALGVAATSGTVPTCVVTATIVVEQVD